MISLDQKPNTNEELIRYCGDLISFSLNLSEPQEGGAFLRTNIGHAKTHRKEVIDYIEKDIPRLDSDWHDIEMKRISDTEFSVTLPLIEVGVFAAKTFFKEPENKKIIWPQGGNVEIKVEPAEAIAGNSIYTAFIRQFNERDSKEEGTFRNFIKKS